MVSTTLLKINYRLTFLSYFCPTGNSSFFLLILTLLLWHFLSMILPWSASFPYLKATWGPSPGARHDGGRSVEACGLQRQWAPGGKGAAGSLEYIWAGLSSLNLEAKKERRDGLVPGTSPPPDRLRVGVRGLGLGRRTQEPEVVSFSHLRSKSWGAALLPISGCSIFCTQDTPATRSEPQSPEKEDPAVRERTGLNKENSHSASKKQKKLPEENGTTALCNIHMKSTREYLSKGYFQFFICIH